MSASEKQPSGLSWLQLLMAIGPALIVASVVMGPGSILANSKVGWKFGYEMVWLLAGACLLLFGMTALSARAGVFQEESPCGALAGKLGRPAAIFIGIVLFLVVALFQFSNNLGVLFGLEPLSDAFKDAPLLAVGVLAGLNLGLIALLFTMRSLYRFVEIAMKVLVGIMMLGFAGNLLLAQPNVLELLQGFFPHRPEALAESSTIPTIGTGADGKPTIDDGWAELLALVGTTFSVGGAFYQGYLVRQKGWTPANLREGLFDSAVGIAALGVMSLMVMATAAAVLHENPAVNELKHAGQVAEQLRPLFGGFATPLFAVGILAGALSSFLVNAMIGGVVFSDALGQGSEIDTFWPKLWTSVALLAGFAAAVAVKLLDYPVGSQIIVAQGLTVAGNPLLAAAILYLALDARQRNPDAAPWWLVTLGVLGGLFVLALSARTAYLVFLKTWIAVGAT